MRLLLPILLMTTAAATSTCVKSDEFDSTIAGICNDVKEVAYASYINSQQGTSLETTLIRLNSIYVNNDDMYKLVSRYVRITYVLSAPPISMSLQDTAKKVSTLAQKQCTNELREAMDEMISDEDNQKVGM